MDKAPEVDIEKYQRLVESRTLTYTESVVKEPPARFCSSSCRVDYREDLLSGVVYPTEEVEGEKLTRRQKCAKLNLCCYCEVKLEN